MMWPEKWPKATTPAERRKTSEMSENVGHEVEGISETRGMDLGKFSS